MKYNHLKRKKAAFTLLTALMFTTDIFSAPDYPSNSISSDADNEISREEPETAFTFTGNITNLFIYQKTKEYFGRSYIPSGKKKLFSNKSRIRLSPEWNFKDELIMHIDYDNELLATNFNDSYEFDNLWKTSQYNDFAHASYTRYRDTHALYRMKIHRAYLKYTKGKWTLSAGRQLVRFGSGKLWNPLDILNPITPTAFEGANEQKGIDAARADFYATDATAVTGIFSPRRADDLFRKIRPSSSNYLARINSSFGENDLSLIAGYVARQKVAGVDAQCTVVDGILRGSFLHARPEDGEKYNLGGAGYEYSFANGLNLLTEYFYNSAPLNKNKPLYDSYMRSFFSGINKHNYYELSNRFITMNSHYAGIMLSYNIHPLVLGELFSIYDFAGHGLFYTVSLKWNVLENLDFNAGVLCGETFNGAKYSSDFEGYDRNPAVLANVSFYF